MRRLPPGLPRLALTSFPNTTRQAAEASAAVAAAAGAPVLLRSSSQRLLGSPSCTERQHFAPRHLPVVQHRTFLTALAPLFSTRSPPSPRYSSASNSDRDDNHTYPTAFSPSSLSDEDATTAEFELPQLPFRFETGVALFAKRAPRPFPPPFLSPPSGSFSDPLSTHHRGRVRGWPADRATFVDGQLIRGWTNGDDAVFASDLFICANDGVGAWSTRPRGHAGLWARLILHFWANAIFEDAAQQGTAFRPDPVLYMQRAYERTLEATREPNDWQGTTTASGALLHYRMVDEAGSTPDTGVSERAMPLLYVTNIGDSQVMVVRPSARKLVFKTVEQWHWFDCPRQLGTNSPDTPQANAALDAVEIEEGDVVLAMSDGVIDNLWPHEIVENVSASIEKWNSGSVAARAGRHRSAEGLDESGMAFVAQELMEAARTVALDPFAESPFMEHAIEEGLASEGGKMDDISVVAALCRRNDQWK